jgi:porin
MTATRAGALALGLLLTNFAASSIAQDACAADSTCPAFDLSAGYTADLRRNTTGGAERGNATSGLLELGAVWTTDSLLPGALVTSTASLIHTAGGAISGRYVGDLQGLNNIEAGHGLRLYEFWSEIRFGHDSATTTRMGFLDLNAEFDAPVTSAFFVGPPFGIGTDLAQTGENGPAVFPVTSLGVRFAGSLSGSLRWRAAAFDGHPGHADESEFAAVDLSRRQGALLIGEVEAAPAGFNKIAAGVWTYTAAFERLDAAARGDGLRRKGNRGGYITIDRLLASWGDARIDGMLRGGVADPRFNAVSRYAGAAVVASGIWSSRPEDAIGIAMAHGRTSDAFRRQLAFDGGAPRRTETQWELTWRAPVADWLALVPTVQWIDNPGADRALRDALVLGLRFELSFEHRWPLLARARSPASDAPLVMTNP